MPWPWQFPATASFATTAACRAIAGAWSASARCSSARPRHESGMKAPDRLRVVDWARISAGLDSEGHAVIERVVSPAECAAVAALYPDDDRFRARVVMERHGFGRGEYKYFSYPLPEIIGRLRTAIYLQLA